MACVEEYISERESRSFEGLVNYIFYNKIMNSFGKSAKFKKYLMLEVDFCLSLGRVCMV